MAVLHSGLLRSYPFTDSPSHKLTFSQTPKSRFQASTATFHGSSNSTLSNHKNPNHKNPPTHITSIVKTPNHAYLSPETNPEVDHYFSLLESNSLSDFRQAHAQFVKLNAFESNGLIGNKLAILYSKGKDSMDSARKLFDEIPERTVPAYAALIRSFCRSERWGDLFSVLWMMVEEGMLPNKYLVPTILKACSANKLLRRGKMVHGYVVRRELESDVFVGNVLIDLYANCKDLRYSKSVFDTMRERDVVTWTALVSAYMEESLLDEAMEIFRLMQLNGVKPDLISWNALVSGFARNGEIDLAMQSLEEMQGEGLKPRVNSWNGIISGCVQSGYFQDALDAFNMMIWFPEDPNSITIVSILTACSGMKSPNLGRAVHGYALKRELCRNIHVEGSLIDMYSKCGWNDYAEEVFVKAEKKNTAMWNEMIAAYVDRGEMKEALRLLRLMQNDGLKPDVITYNTMLAGHARNGQQNEAYELLSEMIRIDLKPNIVTYNVLVSGFQQSGLSYEALKVFRTMQSPSCSFLLDELLNVSTQPNSITATGALAACADLKLLCQGKEIHGYILRNGFEPNIYVSSTLVDMYTKCNDMGLATEVFRIIEDRNTICWNALIAGHVNNMQPEMGLKRFSEMLGEGIEPSSITFMILLPACGHLEALRLGRELHGYIIKSQYDESKNTLASSLIEMYSKCTSVLDAKLVFDSKVKEDVALWNSMISAYSFHGMAKKAIALFEQMKSLGIVADPTTYILVLSACACDGLVEEGWKYFNSMKKLSGITASLEHYTCMVGILSGAGLLDEALDFIRQMPYAPNACMWATLLQASKIHSNGVIGERAEKVLFELEQHHRLIV